jgi:YHS domain-containing protein
MLSVVVLGASVSASAVDLPVAMDGKCPVCLVKMDKVVEGKAEYASDYDGKTYRFPSAKQKKMFDADPAKFVPALGGDCAVCLVEMGRRVAGKPEHALVHDGRLFLFPERKQLDMFKRNPAKYANADLALGGDCPVCLVKMNKVVKGDPQFAAIHDGLRYLFPSPDQKKMFERDPAGFTPALGGDCVVCKVEMNKAVPGKAEFQTVHNGRLYLFPGQKQLDVFKKNPSKYADADLALGGNCVVCKVEMNKDVAGKDRFAVDYQGKRYLFPSPKQREMFLGNPAKYASE